MKNGSIPYHIDWKKDIWKMFLGLAALLLLLSLSLKMTSENAEKAAEDFGRKVEKRLRLLDGYADEVLASDSGNWSELKKLPEDMVIYKYVFDTLQSWYNQFPVRNDDISTRMVLQSLTNLRH